MEWLPIESAPRGDDEELIIAYGKSEDGVEYRECVFWCPSEAPDLRTAQGQIFKGNEWCWATQDGPTFHESLFQWWMPFPDAPKP